VYLKVSIPMVGKIVILFVALCVITNTQNLNLRPIIGIIAQPTEEDEQQYGKAYIPASYVKFIESAGGRVVPILFDTPQNQLKELFGQINGVFIPGGSSDIDGTPLYYTVLYLYQLALEANDKGDYFPIQGHCMGFELLNVITSQNFSLLQPFDAENLSLPLNFYDNYRQSRVFANADQDILDILSRQAVTLNNHHYGVPPNFYDDYTKLHSFYRLISWNVDRENNKFISTIEGINYPVYAFQWHAEKAAFEWKIDEDINHSTDSVKANQYIASFFISEARKSMHKFVSPEAEYSSLIYNYPVSYSASYDSFTQIYFFK